jgi:tetratricopeptide (TPR) repeat protein
MAGRYGMTFAKKHIEDGEYDDAVRVTTEEIALGTAAPETFVDRAMALDLLGRYDEAAADFEHALELDRTERELVREDVDDAYFSALASGAEKLAERSVPDAVAMLDRYARCLPDGRHLAEAAEWKLRVRGELKTVPQSKY